MTKTTSRTTVLHYLDEAFIAVKTAGQSRPDDLVVESKAENGLVLCEFNHFVSKLPLLPSEARQLADTLNYLADCIDPPEDE